MKCNVCGRHTQNDEANFCEYCGSPYKEHMKAYYDVKKEHISGDQYIYDERGGSVVPNEQDSKPVTFLDFLASYGIFFIPFAGWLVFFIMLIVWSFSDKTPTSKKNWAKATLIFFGVLFVLMILYLMYVMTTPLFQNMMTGTFEYNKYIR
jgi:magnesium-transporting ATPase (P-type)